MFAGRVYSLMQELGRLMTTNRNEFEVLSDDPLATQVLPEVLREKLTPNDAFYVRNHYPIPESAAVPPLRIQDLDGRSREVTLDTLTRLPAKTIVTTMACAGNGRSFLKPTVAGLQFAYGAVGTAEWTGVPVHEVLAAEDLTGGVQEVVFWGADQDPEGHDPYGRSLALAHALHPDTLLAYQMNGVPLSPEHGAPLRLVVPAWYGMASVKWLARIELIAEPFEGYYQATKYRYKQHVTEIGEPVRSMRVQALWSLSPGTTLAPGEQLLAGVAWSGDGPIKEVMCSGDGGESWSAAVVEPPTSAYAWQQWRWCWQAEPGSATLLCRATDATGQTQPLEPPWNALGYGNNAVQRLEVLVASDL